MQVIRTETRRRSWFGRLVALLFWLWNLLMAAVTGTAFWAFDRVTDQAAQTSENGTAVMAGAGISVFVIMVFWLVGSLILGIAMAFTRGRVVVVERSAE